MFRQVVSVKVTAILMVGPEIALLGIVQSIRLTLLTFTGYNAHAPSHPCVKEILIHQTRPPSSIVLLYSSDPCMPIVAAFDCGHGQLGHPDWSAVMQTAMNCVVFFMPFCHNQHELVQQFNQM